MTVLPASALLERLVCTVNAHDLDGLVALFSDDVVSEQPMHPSRNFTGRAQIRTNWTEIFGAVPDLHADLIRSVADGDAIWAEWSWIGTRRDGAPFALRGVTVLVVRDDVIARVTFYLEPVEVDGAAIGQAVREAVGAR
jgi:ketosteroid isomerase-like protein